MPWVKGQSGNPGGRPKGAKGFAALIRAETDDCRDLLARLLKIAENAEREQDAINAIKLLLAYALGKPTERVEIEATVESGPHDATSAERALRVRALLESRGLAVVPKGGDPSVIDAEVVDAEPVD